jgi:hypothetical protein
MRAVLRTLQVVQRTVNEGAATSTKT